MLAEHLAGGLTRRLRKRTMRSELLRRMEGPTGDSANIIREIATYLEDKPHLKVVSLFAALSGEVDLRRLPSEIQRVWVFPKVEGEELTFHRVEDPERELTAGTYGIPEPIAGLKRVGIEEIDLFLCPGLGFDLHGGRIGRGKGFYDRALGAARAEAVKLGICFGHQLVDEVVMEEHDIRMNGVIAG